VRFRTALQPITHLLQAIRKAETDDEAGRSPEAPGSPRPPFSRWPLA